MTDPVRTFLVTGGSGFLGRTIVDRLLADGAGARTLARRRDPSLPDAVEQVEGSILDEAAVRDAAAGTAGVFHTAGRVVFSRRGADDLRALHVDGTLHVIRAAAAAGARVVYASTSGVVAPSRDPSFVATEASPYATEIVRRWPYYATKIEAERAGLEEAARAGVELVALRPALVLGPGDTRLSSSAFIADFLRRRIPALPAGGVSTVDVRDAADAFVAAMERGRPGATYLIGNENVTFADIAGRLEKITGIRAPRMSPPYPVAWLSSALVAGALGLIGKTSDRFDPVLAELTRCYWYVDASRAREELGFAPRPLEQTLVDAVAWIRERLDLPATG